jgi:hypothetical protein
MKYLLLILSLILIGCGESRPLEPVPAPAPGVGDQLRELGSIFLWWGGIVLGIGVIARIILALAVPAAIAAFIPGVVPAIATIIAEAGAVSIACGASFTWLADYLWMVVISCVLAGGAWAYLHRHSIRNWLNKHVVDKKEK